MHSPRFAHPDAERTRLRGLVATIDREISRVPRPVPPDDGGAPASDLLASWTELVEALALGPEPEVRACPVCGRIGMRAATRCGYCWTKLTPPTGREGVVG